MLFKIKEIGFTIITLLLLLFISQERINAQANVYVNPSNIILSGQSSVSVDVMISNVTNLHSYQVSLTFNNTVLSCQSVARGPFLRSGGTSSIFFVTPTTIIDSINVEEAISGSFVVSGSGKLFSITFNALAAGNSPISIARIQLRDLDNNNIPVTWNTGEIIVPLSVNTKIFLQGPFNSSSMNTTLNSFGYLPLSQPYSVNPWNYKGTESVLPGFFSSHPNIVDWMLVELRTGTGHSTEIEQRVGFLLNTGNIVGLDGISPIYFLQTSDNYYVVIYHRNHIPIMSSSNILLNYASTLYDFTTAQSKAFGVNAMVQLGTNIFGMYSADANGDQTINATDLNSYWIPQNGTTFNYQTTTADFNLDGTINATDLNNFWIPNNGRASQVPN